MQRPRIFVSTVTSELGTARKKVCDVLHRLGYEAISQDDFPTGHGELKNWLRDQIDSCDGLLQIVGKTYGAEPPDIDEAFDRVSYTQYEFLYARSKKKKTWVIFVTDKYEPDLPLDKLDLPPTPNYPDPIGYQAQRRALQAEYSAGLRDQNHLRHKADKPQDLEVIVLKLKDELAELRKGFRRWQIAVLAAIILTLLLVALAIYKQSADATKTQNTVETGAIKTEQKIDVSKEQINEHTEQVGQKVVQQVSSLIKELPAQKARQIVSSVSGTSVFSIIGLKPLGTAPCPVNQIAGSGMTVLLSAPGFEARSLALPAGEDDIQAELLPAKLPSTENKHKSTLLNLEFVWIAPGVVNVGSTPEELGSNASERPVTKAKISSGFWIATCEITNENAALFLPWIADAAKTAPHEPAGGITWNEAVDFCEKLTQFEQEAHRLPVGYRYSLPSEAEWEFACRGGTTTPFFTGEGDGTLNEFAWSRDNSGKKPHPIAQKKPNALGLYDICGNVEEWCLDWFGSYSGGTTEDPHGARAGTQRVSRGGSYETIALRDSRCASRQHHSPDERIRSVGFRIVLRYKAGNK